MERPAYLNQINQQLSVHPVCALLGPRQCGKTTLAAKFSSQWKNGTVHHFDLENPEDLLALQNPMRMLEGLTGLVVIDEVQRLPELFPILRVLADKKQAHYLILGSASRELIKQSSETLAGRMGTIELTPFHLSEILAKQNSDTISTLLIRGGFPRAFLADTNTKSELWLKSYIQTFLERDIPALGFNVPPLMLRRFWMMLTHVHAQLLNMSMLATSLSISSHYVRQYLDILAGTFMIRVMPPWFENIGKRQTKSPKIFFRDTGILLSLLDIHSYEALLRHPSCGAVWEGFALEQVIQSLNVRHEEAFFWRTQHGAELDLLIFKQGKKFGFEFKFSDAPATTKSMHQSIEDLQLEHLFIIYPGKRKMSLKDKITAIGLEEWILEPLLK